MQFVRLQFFDASIETVNGVKHLVMFLLVSEHVFLRLFNLIQQLILFNVKHLDFSDCLIEMSLDLTSCGNCLNRQFLLSFALVQEISDPLFEVCFHLNCFLCT